MESNPSSRKHSRGKSRRLLPVPVVALVDILLTGAALCVFALFHHVLPRVSDNQGTAIPRPAASAVSSPESGGGNAGDVSDPSGGDVPDSSADAALTGWAGKWPDRFSDTVEKTENSYRSPNVSITLEKTVTTRKGDAPLVYIVADIYINSIDNLKAGLAGDKFGHGLRENLLDMAERNGAILAVNGDYYSNRTEGPVVRNGLLYRESPFEDVCVLYADGVMETYAAEELDMEEAKARGAYQIWSFGPRLLDADGKAMTEFVTTVGGANPRTAIGYYEPGHYCMVLVEGRQPEYSTGMTMSELSALFESLGCTAAYNLDGGQSSMMAFDGQVYNQPANGGRTSGDIVYIAEIDG